MRPSFDSVVSGLYEAAAVSYNWPIALQGLAELTGSRGALITRPDRQHDSLVFSSGLGDTVAQFFEQGWHRDDLRSNRMVASAQTGFICDQDITTSDERSRSDYYLGFARSAGVPWFAACGLVNKDGVAIGVSIQRSAAQGSFDDADLKRLRRIRPHVEAAMAFARDVTDRVGAERLDALELAQVPAFVVDQDGILRDLNPAGHAQLAKSVTTRRRRLTAVDPASRAALARLITNATELAHTPDAAKVAPVRLACADGSAVLAHAMPLRGAAHRFANARAILTLSVIADPTGAAADALAVAYGLTPAEARVAHHLSRGLEVEEIARDIGLSVGAVRFHLKSILPKAGVRRQAAFVARAATLIRQ